MDIQGLSTRERRELYEVVLAAAYRITRSHADARDATQEAFECATTELRDPTRSLEKQMLGILGGVILNARRAARRRQANEAAAATVFAREADVSAPSPEDVVVEAEERDARQTIARRHVAALRATLKERKLTFELELCELMSQGVAKPAELARRTGRKSDEVVAARERMRRILVGIMAAERAERGERADSEEVA